MPQKIEAETSLWKDGGSKLEPAGGPGLGKLKGTRRKAPEGLYGEYEPSVTMTIP